MTEDSHCSLLPAQLTDLQRGIAELTGQQECFHSCHFCSSWRHVQELFKDGTWRESIKGHAKREETPWSASKGRRVAISVGVRAARNCKHGDIPCNRGTLTTNSTDKCTLLFVCSRKVGPYKDYVTVLVYPTLQNFRNTNDLVQGYWVWLACTLVTAAC